MNNRDRLKELVKYQLGIFDEDMIKDNASFVEDLGADELDRVELMIGMVEEFGIAIEETDAEKLLTFGDALEYVEKKLQEKAKSHS